MINWKHRQIFKMSTLSEIVDTYTSGNIDEEGLEESMFQLYRAKKTGIVLFIWFQLTYLGYVELWDII